MSQLNLTQLRAHVRSLTGIQSTAIVSDADIDIFINEAYQEINREADWPFLRAQTTLTTSSNVATYSLPAGVSENAIASVAILSNDVNRRQLRPRSRYSTDDSPGPYLIGRPKEYSVWDGVVELYPTPDASETINIRYFSEIANLSSGSDVPVFDAKFHSLVAYGASVRVLIREGDETERRGYYNLQFKDGMEQMKGDYLTERDRSIMRLGGRRRIFGRRDNNYGV